MKAARKASGLTQEQLAKKVGMSQSNLSDLENDKYPSSSFTAQLADAVGVSGIWLAECRGTMRPADVSQNPAAEEPVASSCCEHQRPDLFVVPIFDARASMGLGAPQPDHETVVDHMRLTKDWVRAHLPTISAPHNLAVLSAFGDSMSPTLSDGDIMLVDRGVNDLKIDAVYVLALNDELYVKRIQRRITDGAIIIKSDNALYDPVVVTNGEKAGLRVLGRVVWAWNGRKM